MGRIMFVNKVPTLHVHVAPSKVYNRGSTKQIINNIILFICDIFKCITPSVHHSYMHIFSNDRSSIQNAWTSAYGEVHKSA